MVKQKSLPPHHIYLKEILSPLSFRFIIIPLFAGLLFIFHILEIPTFIGVIIFFAFLFIWRDSEVDYFTHDENKINDWKEIVIWILSLVITIFLVNYFFP